MTEPSSKSEVCQHNVPCGLKSWAYQHDPDQTGYLHPFKPQPPVSAPEKCPRCGLTKEQCAKASASLDFEDDSAQPTPSEGPYHPAMDRLSVKFGPDEFQVKFSSPETVGTECILMNMGFAQGQASSAKEIEFWQGVATKAQENERQLKARWDELKSFFTHEEHPILPNRLEIKRKIAELEKQ